LADVDCPAQGAPLNFASDICDSALEPNRWASVLRGTARLIKGCAAAIIAHAPGEDTARIEASWNVSSKLERAMVATAPFAPSVPAIWLLGIERAFTTNALFGGEKLHASLWHKQALQPEGLNDVAIVPLMKTARAFSTLMVMRPAAAGPYLPDDAAVLSALTPYFRRAATISGLLDFMPLARHCRASNFDPMTVGIILTDATGKIVHTNDAAEKLLDGCALLCLEDELAARDYGSDELLRAAIANAARVRRDRPYEVPAPIIVRGLGAKSLAVTVTPINERIRLPVTTSCCARVAVFVRYLNPDETAAEAFVRRHPITIAESRLLALLAQDLTLDQAARALPLSTSAARARLADILQRTRTRDEADLIARMTGKRALVSA
jgi:hypothetical protein